MYRANSVKWTGHISNKNRLEKSFLKEIFRERADDEEDVGSYVCLKGNQKILEIGKGSSG
jgi:hypothetical protein